MEPKAGAIAFCSHGWLGLITSETPELVHYPDGNTGEAWTGIHLTEGKFPVGYPWSARNPKVVGYIEDFKND